MVPKLAITLFEILITFNNVIMSDTEYSFRSRSSSQSRLGMFAELIGGNRVLNGVACERLLLCDIFDMKVHCKMAKY